MLTPLPFALQAPRACVPHAELALSLAAAFHEIDAERVDEQIEALASQLLPPPSSDPIDELHAMSDLLGGAAMPEAAIGADVCCLMIDDALAQGVAHPLVRAVIAVEAGRRRGFDVGVVSNGSEHCVAHEGLDEPLLVRADDGAVVDAHTLPDTLQWYCSHEVCGLLLDELERRWLLWTRIDNALQAANLRLSLPLDEESSQAARLSVERVRARLN